MDHQPQTGPDRGNAPSQPDEVYPTRMERGISHGLRAHTLAGRDEPAVVILPTLRPLYRFVRTRSQLSGDNRVLVIVPTKQARQIATVGFRLTEGQLTATTPTIHELSAGAARTINQTGVRDADVVVGRAANAVALADVLTDEEYEFHPGCPVFDRLVIVDGYGTVDVPDTVRKTFDFEHKARYITLPRAKSALPEWGTEAYRYPIAATADKDAAYRDRNTTVVELSSPNVDRATRNTSVFTTSADTDIPTEAQEDLLSAYLQHIDDNEPTLVYTDKGTRPDVRELFASTDAEVFDVTEATTRQMKRAMSQGNHDFLIRDAPFDLPLPINSATVVVAGKPAADGLVSAVTTPRATNDAASVDNGTTAQTVVGRDILEAETTKEAVRSLYRDDNAWPEFVPKLFKSLSTLLTGEDRFDAVRAADPEDFKPRESVTVYDVAEDKWQDPVTTTTKTGAELEIDVVSIDGGLSLQSDYEAANFALDTDCFGFVITGTETPDWANDILKHPQYHLVVYYYDRDGGYLFEYASHERLATQCRQQLVESEIVSLPGRQLSALMRSEDPIKYYSAGLQNTVLPTGGVADHKTLSGRDVKGAIRPSDARVFTQSHVFGKLDNEVRGVSSNGRVWTTSSSVLSKFREWCRERAEQLRNTDPGGARGLEYLNNTEPIEKFNAPVTAVMLNASAFAQDIEITHNDITRPVTETRLDLSATRTDVETAGSVNGKHSEADTGENDTTDENPKTLRISLATRDEDETIATGEYNVNVNDWKGELSEVTFRDSSAQSEPLTGQEFFQRYPPVFYQESGEPVIGGERRITKDAYTNYDVSADASSALTIDWDKCDEPTQEEARDTTENDKDKLSDFLWPDDSGYQNLWIDKNVPSSVHQMVVGAIQDKYSGDKGLLFYDHKPGEVADIIHIDGSDQMIRFFHCKGGDPSKPRSGKKRVVEAQEQVMRSIPYVRSDKLTTHIQDRWEDDIDDLSEIESRDDFDDSDVSLQHFIFGGDKFKEFKSEYSPSTWEFEIYIVNPGLKTDLDPATSTNDENAHTLLVACDEWVSASGADFMIIGASGGENNT